MPAEITAEQLLLNDLFIQYHIDPNEYNTRQWHKFVTDKAIPSEVIAEAAGMLGMLSPALPIDEIEEEVAKLKNTFSDRESLANTARLNVLRRLTVSVAAVLVIGLTAGIWYYAQQQKTDNIITESATAVGQRRTVRLPDGSTVILNSGSSISYAENLGAHTRTIELKGSAFFDVKKDPQKPFIVRSGDLETIALGTSFYVAADSIGNYAVRLLTGKVKVSSAVARKQILLNPGERAGWITARETFTHSAFDTGSLEKWITGRLEFDNTPVQTAFEMLEDWYNVKIIDQRPAKIQARINGTYENADLKDVLTVMCFSLGCRFTYNDNHIIIE